MDFGKAFLFVRDDEGWIGKLLVGAAMVVFSALIVPSFWLLGYQIALIRNVMDGEERPLPGWGDDPGGMIKDGIMVFVAGLIYALPIILMSVCNAVASAAFSGDSDTAAFAVAVSVAFACLAVIWGIAIAFMAPALYIQYARTGELGAMLRFGEVFAFARDNAVDILLTIIANWVAGVVFGLVFLLSIITICGWIVILLVGPVWITYFQAHLYGQIGAKSAGKKPTLAY